MKTFEVYGLYDAGHRGRTLVAVVQADLFEVQENGCILFFTTKLFSRQQVGEIRVGNEFAVLEAAFSGSILRDVAPPPPDNPDIATPAEEAAWREIETAATPAPRRRRKKDSILNLS